MICAAAILLANCAGYRVGNISGAEMKGVKTIYVPVVKNETLEPGLQVMTTNAILERIDQDGTFQSSRSRNADAILEVTIKKFRRETVRNKTSNVSVALEYTIVLEAEVTVTNLLTGTRVLDKVAISGETDMFLFEDAQESERQQLAVAAQNLSYHIVKRISEGW